MTTTDSSHRSVTAMKSYHCKIPFWMCSNANFFGSSTTMESSKPALPPIRNSDPSRSMFFFVALRFRIWRVCWPTCYCSRVSCIVSLTTSSPRRDTSQKKGRIGLGMGLSYGTPQETLGAIPLTMKVS
jgi:hypothetical protein